MSYSRKDHYELERKLANRLRTTNKDQRRALYTEIYDTLFQQIPDHPMLTRKASVGERARQVAHQVKLLAPFSKGRSTFLEIGPGDCKLSFATSVR